MKYYVVEYYVTIISEIYRMFQRECEDVYYKRSFSKVINEFNTKDEAEKHCKSIENSDPLLVYDVVDENELLKLKEL